MAKSGGMGAGAKKMGGPGKKPLPPSPMMGAPGGTPGGAPGGGMGAFKKGGPVAKPFTAKQDAAQDKRDAKKGKK